MLLRAKDPGLHRRLLAPPRGFLGTLGEWAAAARAAVSAPASQDTPPAPGCRGAGAGPEACTVGATGFCAQWRALPREALTRARGRAPRPRSRTAGARLWPHSWTRGPPPRPNPETVPALARAPRPCPARRGHGTVSRDACALAGARHAVSRWRWFGQRFDQRFDQFRRSGPSGLPRPAREARARVLRRLVQRGAAGSAPETAARGDDSHIIYKCR